MKHLQQLFAAIAMLLTAASINAQSIERYYLEDFDQDGKLERYYFTGTSLNADANSGDEYENIYNSKLYYIDGKKELVYELEYAFPPTLVRLEARPYLLVREEYPGGIKTSLLQGKEAIVIGDGYDQTSDSEFELTLSTYDATYNKQDDMYTGHTWKPYWYYADETGIHEYGAIEITREQFLQIPNAVYFLAQVIQYFKDKGITPIKAYEYWYRANGIVNINLKSEGEEITDYYYVTLTRNSNNALVFEKPEYIDDVNGSYAAAMNPDLAVYPESIEE